MRTERYYGSPQAIIFLFNNFYLNQTRRIYSNLTLRAPTRRRLRRRTRTRLFVTKERKVRRHLQHLMPFFTTLYSRLPEPKPPEPPPPLMTATKSLSAPKLKPSQRRPTQKRRVQEHPPDRSSDDVSPSGRSSMLRPVKS